MFAICHLAFAEHIHMNTRLGSMRKLRLAFNTCQSSMSVKEEQDNHPILTSHASMSSDVLLD